MRIKHSFLFVLVGLAAFTGTALAAGEVAPEGGTWVDALRPVLDAIVGGHYLIAAALALVVGTALAAKYGARYWAPLGTGAGKAGLVLVGSFAGAIATALTGGAVLGLPLMWAAIKVAVAAAGGYSLLKELLGVIPWPAWMRPIINLVLRLFNRPDPAIEVKAAGDAAVAASPAPGIGSVIRPPRDVP